MQLTVVVLPIANRAPSASVASGSVQAMVTGGDTSPTSCALILRAARSRVAPLMLSAIRVTGLLGKLVKTGGVVSWTITLKLPLADKPPESVTEQFTAVVPSRKVLPLAGTQATEAVRSPSSRSPAVTVKFTTAPALLVASAVMSSGRTRKGGVFSSSLSQAVKET